MISGSQFYDNFYRKHIKDYIHENSRTEAAITHTLRNVPVDSNRILDIGCGIGWSTWEIKRHFPDSNVMGLDLSEKMIKNAVSLFQTPGLDFTVCDITDENNKLPKSSFDAVVMLDVYEHIPKENRKKTHQILKEILTDNGVLIMTFPSVAHQEFLRKNRQAALQPVDEDATREDISLLADDIEGRVTCFKHVSVWKKHDYIHVVIKRGSDHIAKSNRRIKKTISLEPKAIRAQRVLSRLKVRVTQEGLFLQDNEGQVVCIVMPKIPGYSETFVRAHIERLPAKIRFAYKASESWLPLYGDHGKPLLPYTRIHNVPRKVFRKFLGLHGYCPDKMAFKRFLLGSKAVIVLAEYGVIGVAVMDVCRKVGVPLIVYFRGFDAYNQFVLQKEGRHYPKLFMIAAAIVVVSRDMEQQLYRLGAPKEKIYYNPSGVDISLFQDADPSKAPPNFIAVGRFTEKKAPNLTLLAFKRVLEAIPEARLVMIGDGPLLETCKQLSISEGIGHAVEFLGARAHFEVAEKMRAARAFVQHSVRAENGDSEGTPNSVLEAGASGLPVVATRHAGIKDAVIDGKTGLLVDEGDVEGMAERMIMLAQDPLLAQKMGTEARKRICSEYSMEKSIGKLWEIIQNVIKSNT